MKYIQQDILYLEENRSFKKNAVDESIENLEEEYIENLAKGHIEKFCGILHRKFSREF